MTHSGELGAFLRSRRERLTPATCGLPTTRRRRTPGLRREEVASLAGISAEWYVKLEQGRAVAPSREMIDALAGALRLDAAEHLHLQTLARETPRPAFVRETIPPGLQRLINRLDQPAYVTGLRWDVLAWNTAAASLVFDFGELTVEDRNILLFMVTDRRARALFGDSWSAEARRMVALFRATHDLWGDDPAFVDLLRRIQCDCPAFDDWWTAHDVGAAIGGTKTLHHPALGRLRFDYATFQANDDPALKLAIYTPASETGR